SRGDRVPRPGRRRGCGGLTGGAGGGDPAAGHLRVGAAVPALHRPVPQGWSAGRIVPAGHRRGHRGPGGARPPVHVRTAPGGAGGRRPAGAAAARQPAAARAPARPGRGPGPVDRGGPGAGVNPLRDPYDRRLPRIPEPGTLVIFGATGDLAHRKLIPAIYDLGNRGLLPPGFGLVGFARRDWDHEGFAKVVRQAAERNARTPWREEVWARLAAGIRFVRGTFEDDAAFDRLAEVLEELRTSHGTAGNAAFYLSIPPAAFPLVLKQLARTGLSGNRGSQGWRRVVVEKPFGHDLASARELNALVDEVFPPAEVFRIDHYLGKETVQNILALRFANTLFEPVWNNRYVDSVQITVAETVGIGTRAGFYDAAGAARDVLQNHMLQLLALVAMEEPTSFAPDEIRAEK